MTVQSAPNDFPFCCKRFSDLLAYALRTLPCCKPDKGKAWGPLGRSLPEAFARLQRLEPGAMAGVTLPKLAQVLMATGVQKGHTHYGNRYRVAEI